MAGILSGLLGLFGLGGCAKNDRIILDGPGMMRDVRTLYVGSWYCGENGVLLEFDLEALHAYKDGECCFSDKWQLGTDSKLSDCAVPVNGDSLAGYAYIKSKFIPPSEESGESSTVLIGYPDKDSETGDVFVYERNPLQDMTDSK